MPVLEFFNPHTEAERIRQETAAKPAKHAKVEENQQVVAANSLLNSAKVGAESGARPPALASFSSPLAAGNPQKVSGLAGLAGLAGVTGAKRVGLGGRPDPDLSNPGAMRAWLRWRTGLHRDFGREPGAAELAFDELIQVWFRAHPPKLRQGLCAACGKPTSGKLFMLPDGAEVCTHPQHGCLIEYGRKRRAEAEKALKVHGISP